MLAAAAALERTRERHAAAAREAWVRFLRDDAAGKFLELRAAIRAAAGLDALSSLSALARSDGYCRPDFLSDDLPVDAAGASAASTVRPPTLHIADGRHPILDATLAGGKTFVPNSVNPKP